MRVDLYTKTVLTVIAGALVWLCFLQMTPAVHAQNPVAAQRVVITGFESDSAYGLPVTLVSVAQGRRVTEDQWGRKVVLTASWDHIRVNDGH